MILARSLAVSSFLTLVLALGACGAPPAATEAEPSEAEQPLETRACPSEKIQFSQAKGCENDGSVEFCVPAKDAALRGRLDALGVGLTYGSSSGRARCDREQELLVFFPTPKEDRRVCTSEGGLRRRPWAQLCTIAREAAVRAIVPTFYE